MKTELTKEQSQHLIDLGVPKEKASGKYFVPQGKPIVSSVGVLNEIAKSYPIFKLGDFLNGEILPTEIVDTDMDWWMELIIQYSAPQQKWFVGYFAIGDKDRGVQFVRHSKELINAFYEITCWYYNDYLKSEKK